MGDTVMAASLSQPDKSLVLGSEVSTASLYSSACQTLEKYTVLPHDAQKIREQHYSDRRFQRPCQESKNKGTHCVHQPDRQQERIGVHSMYYMPVLPSRAIRAKKVAITQPNLSTRLE
eukprot:123090-Pelagomonas_calceolata.AAC.1